MTGLLILGFSGMIVFWRSFDQRFPKGWFWGGRRRRRGGVSVAMPETLVRVLEGATYGFMRTKARWESLTFFFFLFPFLFFFLRETDRFALGSRAVAGGGGGGENAEV